MTRSARWLATIALTLAAGTASARAEEPVELVPTAVVDVPVERDDVGWHVRTAYATRDGFAAAGYTLARHRFMSEADEVLLFDDAGGPVARATLPSQLGLDEVIELADGSLVALHATKKEPGDDDHARLTLLRREGAVLRPDATVDLPSKYAFTAPRTPDSRVLIRPIIDDEHLLIVDFGQAPPVAQRVELDEESEANAFGQWWLLPRAADGTQHLLASRTIGSLAMHVREIRRYTLRDGRLTDGKSVAAFGFGTVLNVDVTRGRLLALSYDHGRHAEAGKKFMEVMFDPLPLDLVEEVDLLRGERVSLNRLATPIETDWSDLILRPRSALLCGQIVVTTPDNRLVAVAAEGTVTAIGEPLPNSIDGLHFTADGERLVARSRAVYEADGNTLKRPAAVHLFDRTSLEPPTEPTFRLARRLTGPIEIGGSDGWNLKTAVATDRGFVVAARRDGDAHGAIAAIDRNADFAGWAVASRVADPASARFVPLDDNRIAAAFSYADGDAADSTARTALVDARRDEDGRWIWQNAVYVDGVIESLGRTNRTGVFVAWTRTEEGRALVAYDAEAGLAVFREIDLGGQAATGDAFVDDAGVLHWLARDDGGAIALWSADEATAWSRRVGFGDAAAFDLVTGEIIVRVTDATSGAGRLLRYKVADADAVAEQSIAVVGKPMLIHGARVCAGRLVVQAADRVSVISAAGELLGETGTFDRPVLSATMNPGGTRLVVFLGAAGGEASEVLVYDVP